MRIDLHADKPVQRHIQMFAAFEGANISWRLLSGNNREIGRGAQSFADVVGCRLALQRLQSVVSDLEPTISRAGNGWGWSLALNGDVVATSKAAYDRQIRCRQSLSHFLVEFADSSIGRNVMWTHSRRWVMPGARVIQTGSRG